jgi:hypothetical protein
VKTRGKREGGGTEKLLSEKQRAGDVRDAFDDELRVFHHKKKNFFFTFQFCFSKPPRKKGGGEKRSAWAKKKKRERRIQPGEKETHK